MKEEVNLIRALSVAEHPTQTPHLFVHIYLHHFPFKSEAPFAHHLFILTNITCGLVQLNVDLLTAHTRELTKRCKCRPEPYLNLYNNIVDTGEGILSRKKHVVVCALRIHFQKFNALLRC